jgi:hypothetical protein
MTTCAQCGREQPILARSLCGRCYRGLRRVGKLDRYPALGQRGRPPGPRPIDWRAVAEDRKGEIDRLRERIRELEEAR